MNIITQFEGHEAATPVHSQTYTGGAMRAYGMDDAKAIIRDYGDEWLEFRADGVHLRHQMLQYDPSQVLHWKYVCELDGDDAPNPLTAPCLPFPFTSNQLAAFMLDGIGAAVATNYGNWADGPNPEMIDSMGVLGREHKRALRDAYAACVNAQSKVMSYPLKLQLQVEKLEEEYQHRNSKANTRHSVFAEGISRDEANARRKRAKASQVKLKASLDAIKSEFQAAIRAWRKAMVNELVQPTPAQNKTTPATVLDTTTDQCAVFRAVPNLVANDLKISFVGDKSESGLGANNMLEISALGTKKRIPLSSLGLLDKRNGNLNSQGAMLVGMAVKKRVTNNAKNVKKVQRLRTALRENLGIKDDPFEPYHKITGWKPRFTLADNRGAADKRAKDKAEFRQPSIEQMRLLDRHVSPDESFGQKKDANERRQDFAADDWMLKNGHTFSSDDLHHDN